MSADTSATLEFIQMIARQALLLSAEDVSAVQNELSLIHSAMPIMDPTGYRRIMPTMGGHEDLVRAFARFHAALRNIVEVKEL